MIGKYHWFKRRKYTGWGFSPATWQGWVYIIIAIAPIALLTGTGSIGTIKLALIIVWAIIFIVDFIDIMIHLPKDERDRIHEAIAERNALWVIITVLVIGVIYQDYKLVLVDGLTKVDPVIIAALVAGLVAKIVSNIYLDKKD